MIKVTLGGDEKNELNFFPRLMQYNGSGVIVEVHEHPQDKDKYIAIHRKGEYFGKIVLDFNIGCATDYNEPITLQNA